MVKARLFSRMAGITLALLRTTNIMALGRGSSRTVICTTAIGIVANMMGRVLTFGLMDACIVDRGAMAKWLGNLNARNFDLIFINIIHLSFALKASIIHRIV
jgi:hypothetical protein